MDGGVRGLAGTAKVAKSGGMGGTGWMAGSWYGGKPGATGGTGDGAEKRWIGRGPGDGGTGATVERGNNGGTVDGGSGDGGTQATVERGMVEPGRRWGKRWMAETPADGWKDGWPGFPGGRGNDGLAGPETAGTTGRGVGDGGKRWMAGPETVEPRGDGGTVSGRSGKGENGGSGEVGVRRGFVERGWRCTRAVVAGCSSARRSWR